MRIFTWLIPICLLHVSSPTLRIGYSVEFVYCRRCESQMFPCPNLLLVPLHPLVQYFHDATMPGVCIKIGIKIGTYV